MNTLLELARRYAEAHAGGSGVAATPVKGLVILREVVPSLLQYAITKPLVAVVLQGSKRVTIGATTFDFGGGQSLLITTEVPTVSQITGATIAQPYVSLVLELDLSVIAGLVSDIGPGSSSAEHAVRVDPTEAEVADAAVRLLRLMDRPDALSVLADQLIREVHYWLLCGRHGSAISALGVPDSHARRVARAIAVIRHRYADALRIEELAEAASMSVSAFHAHFRAVTSLTPLQFQKQVRLIEARRRLFGEGAAISDAAYGVGYESVPQFTREYARLFGQPPGRDIRQARAQRSLAA